MILMACKVLLSLITALVPSIAVLGVSSTLAQVVPVPLKTATDKQLGTFLVDAKGMTLYIFDNDKERGKSTCYGGCAETWPPFTPKPEDPSPVAPETAGFRA